MTTNAAKELPGIGAEIEAEIIGDIEHAVEGLSRYSADLVGDDPEMSLDSRGDYLERSDVLAAIRGAS